MESHPRFPIENILGLRSIPEQYVHFSRPLISRVVLYEFLPIKIRVTKGGFDKLTHRVAFAGSKDEVVSSPCLQNSPHASDILRRVSPVTLCFEVAVEHFLLQTMLNPSTRPRDLSRNVTS